MSPGTMHRVNRANARTPRADDPLLDRASAAHLTVLLCFAHCCRAVESLAV
jgi:hypothetical protein